MTPRVLATICARGGSKGVVGKNLQSVGGKPLMAWAVDAARACPAVAAIVVSTDDDRIAEVAESCGLQVKFRRPPELATDTSAKIGAIRHATRWMEEHEGFHADIVLDLDVGVPLRAPEDITACVERMTKGDVDAVVTVYEAERNPYFNMVEFDGSLVRLAKQPQTPVIRRQDAPPVYSITPSVFAFARSALDRVVHLYHGRWGGVVVPRERGIDIDVPLDLEFVEFLLARSGRAPREQS